MRWWVLMLLVLVVPAAVSAEDEEEQGPRLRMMAWGPPETAYTLVDFVFSAHEIDALDVKASDSKGRMLVHVAARPGAVLVYRLARFGGEPEAGWNDRAQAVRDILRKRLASEGLIGTSVTNESDGQIVLRCEPDALDLGADIASLCRSGALEVVPRAAAGTRVWPEDAAALRAFKAEEIERFRLTESPTPNGSFVGYPKEDAQLRLVKRIGKDGAQPYHYRVVSNTLLDRQWNRLSLGTPVLNDPDDFDVAPVVVPIPEGTRKQLVRWHTKYPDDPLAILLHGHYLQDLDTDRGIPEEIEIDLPTFRCRSTTEWIRSLRAGLRGAPLPGTLDFVARVDFTKGARSEVAFYVRAERATEVTATVQAKGAKALTYTRKHVPGHFLKFRHIFFAYFGARLCGRIAVEEAAWVKYQERPLLDFMVAITVSHGDNVASSVLASRMLAMDEKDPKESVRRLGMGLHGEKGDAPESRPAVLRLACVRALAHQAVQSKLVRDDARAHLAKALSDPVLRVRFAAAVELKRLRQTSEALEKVLAEASPRGTDKWVDLWVARLK